MRSPNRALRTGFLASLRGRLIAVMILGLGATAFAVVALSYLARTSRDQRIVRAHERVEAEIERLTEIGPSLTHGQRQRRGRHGSSELRSGFVDASSDMENPWMAELVAEAQATGKTVIKESVTPTGMPLVGGVAPLEGEGYVWAAQRIPVGPETSSLRVSVVCLVIAMFVMVLACVQTLIAFDRGAGSLREAVIALGRDLKAEVPRPRLRELAEVADGLDALARELSRAEEDKVRLMRELAEHERWAALGRVVAGVAHEVRNPLAAIKLRTDLAEVSPDVPALLREDFALIGSEVARLDRLVRDLLLLADRRAEARPRAPVDLAELLSQRMGLLRPWAEGKAVHLAASGAAHAAIDADAVTRALDNLLRNAVEASPSGGTVIARVSEDATRATVTVEDTGAGVTDENAPLVFEPFFTTKPTGTGLGLALSRAVAEAHGGSLHYERREGTTLFTLALAKG
jgi:signal transduction histidine kinase